MTPTMGRTVFFVIPKEQRSEGAPLRCAAIITRIWGDTCVNLRLLPDDAHKNPDLVITPTSVVLDESAEQDRSWHWPARV